MTQKGTEGTRFEVWRCSECGEVAGSKTGFQPQRVADGHWHKPEVVEVCPLADKQALEGERDEWERLAKRAEALAENGTSMAEKAEQQLRELVEVSQVMRRAWDDPSTVKDDGGPENPYKAIVQRFEAVLRRIEGTDRDTA